MTAHEVARFLIGKGVQNFTIPCAKQRANRTPFRDFFSTTTEHGNAETPAYPRLSINVPAQAIAAFRYFEANPKVLSEESLNRIQVNP